MLHLAQKGLSGIDTMKTFLAVKHISASSAYEVSLYYKHNPILLFSCTNLVEPKFYL